MNKVIPLAVFFLLLVASPSGAQQAGLIDVFDDWSAFTSTESGAPVCYIGSEPTKATGDYKKRGKTYILITHRPAENALGVVSLEAGYAFKPGSGVDVAIGTNQFTLFTDGSNAWADDAKADQALVRAMRAGAIMEVSGTSGRGTLTKDTYSLKGITAAYKAASKACGVK
mgnify:CR=1 FL=1